MTTVIAGNSPHDHETLKTLHSNPAHNAHDWTLWFTYLFLPHVTPRKPLSCIHTLAAAASACKDTYCLFNTDALTPAVPDLKLDHNPAVTHVLTCHGARIC